MDVRIANQEKENSGFSGFPMEKEILGFCMQKGLLIDKETLNLFSGTSDLESVKLIIERIKEHTNARMITKSIFIQHKDVMEQVSENQKTGIQNLKIKLGLNIEISSSVSLENKPEGATKIITTHLPLGKKMEVNHFTTYFRNRFAELRGFLQERPELTNLVSINKISGGKQGISIIGMILDKRITKNKNIIFDVEDSTGRIKVIVNQNKKEIYEKADNICLDAVIGFKGSGSKEVFFANELYLPEAFLGEKKYSPLDENAVFISDIHVGSELFLEKSFLKFIDYLNCKIPNTPEAEKIKYLFAVGDIVAGVGVYPNQEKDLEIKDIEGQYAYAAELFGKIRKDIQIIMIPGNHDCVRLAEPQPILDEKYTWPLYALKNIIFASNPSIINIGATKNFPGFDVLMYHGFSYFYYANNIPKLATTDAINSPDRIMHFLLQNRHLAPTHASVQYSPYDKDPLLIRKAPDIFVSGHLHKGAASHYNNILTLSSTCWENLTSFQEKVGAKPDFCKVPMFNLKTRAVKILDFHESNEGRHENN
ncbi:MAG: metallophosphoesterase [Nanoarchaeota archaeon]